MNETVIPARPWWRQGAVWLLLAAPAAAVVGGAATAWVAASQADPVVARDAYRRGVELQRQRAHERALMPAGQARNHAATPTAQP